MRFICNEPVTRSNRCNGESPVVGSGLITPSSIPSAVTIEQVHHLLRRQFGCVAGLDFSAMLGAGIGPQRCDVLGGITPKTVHH